MRSIRPKRGKQQVSGDSASAQLLAIIRRAGWSAEEIEKTDYGEDVVAIPAGGNESVCDFRVYFQSRARKDLRWGLDDSDAFVSFIDVDLRHALRWTSLLEYFVLVVWDHGGQEGFFVTQDQILCALHNKESFGLSRKIPILKTQILTLESLDFLRHRAMLQYYANRLSVCIAREKVNAEFQEFTGRSASMDFKGAADSIRDFEIARAHIIMCLLEDLGVADVQFPDDAASLDDGEWGLTKSFVDQMKDFHLQMIERGELEGADIDEIAERISIVSLLYSSRAHQEGFGFPALLLSQAAPIVVGMAQEQLRLQYEQGARVLLEMMNGQGSDGSGGEGI